MDTTDTNQVFKATAFLILTTISIPANIFVSYVFLRTFVTEGKLMTADIILCHLSFVNLMVALIRSIPQTLVAFGYKNMFDDVGCKFTIFSFRIFRGLSISLTCLLSTYQAVLVSPATSRLAPLKSRIPQYLIHIIVILYVIYCVSNFNAPISAVASFPNNTIPPYTFNLQFCFVSFPNYIGFISGGLVHFLGDLLFIVLMAIMSGYILVLLYKHSKRVKSLRSSKSRQSRARAEVKVSRAVVTLVTLYCLFFGVDNIIYLYSLTVLRVTILLSDIRVFFATLYTSVCPVVIIITNPKVKDKTKMKKRDKICQPTVITTSDV
ncbi:olfactory receptor class A-like protein 1 [Erpetoichthys calabaricus]|uniref:olfactory receptor class A-like protein 1 n=1 Tax=Erpetoichthys calabaricus TaxID=27687 RepID=UPI00109FD56E|nr:olfactory receptor class A-like protein 1 [Erpetoichthys calabaricus]